MLGTWFKDERPAWEKKIENINPIVFKELNIDFEDVKKILDRLYEEGVIQ